MICTQLFFCILIHDFCMFIKFDILFMLNNIEKHIWHFKNFTEVSISYLVSFQTFRTCLVFRRITNASKYFFFSIVPITAYRRDVNVTVYVHIQRTSVSSEKQCEELLITKRYSVRFLSHKIAFSTQYIHFMFYFSR